MNELLKECSERMADGFARGKYLNCPIEWYHEPRTVDEMKKMADWFDDHCKELGIPEEYVNYIMSYNPICCKR